MYHYNKLKKQKSVSLFSIKPLFLEITNELSEKYRNRIANFLKEMTEQPIMENDRYQPSENKLNNLLNFKGPDRMIFSAPRCDRDIKRQMNTEFSYIDPSPTVPEG